MITDLVFLCIFHVVFSDLNSVDLTKCKLTHTGTEYLGKISVSDSNITCLSWESIKQKGLKFLVDEAFPEGSKISAKNYCRNPDKNSEGPWCFTNLNNDTCDVPLCKVSECRITGTGVEYNGLIGKSASGKKCLKWENKHKDPELSNRIFPDGSIKEAGSKCRNPDGSISGPWCYVENDNNSTLGTKELCDIPFCDDLGSMMYAGGNVDKYFFFSSINKTTALNISVRLWDPSDWLNGVYFYLTSYDTEADRDDIERWDSGVEIRISHNGSGILYKKDFKSKKTPLILSGASWTNLKITWVNLDSQRLLIQLFKIPNPKPIEITEIFTPHSIFEIESFRYIALGGSPAFWKIISENSDDCPIHTVTRKKTTRFWLINKTPLGKSVEIFIRAYKNVVITMRTAPMEEISQIQVVFEDKKIQIYSKNNKNKTFQIIEKSWKNALTLWKWEYFKITIIKKKLQLFWVRKANTDLLLEADHENIDKVMWITFGSSNVSYWTIYCHPQGVFDPPTVSPPECVSHIGDLFYGTQSITSLAQQCIPWTDKSSLPEKYRTNALFMPYGGRLNCQNFCRNLDNDPKGAFCFVRETNSETNFAKVYCRPRLCSFSDCQMIGIGSDYVGHLNTTRSKRECKNWAEINDDLINIDKFPDATLEDAANYCRNPSKSIGGSWCYTKDKNVSKDFCFIKDCDRPMKYTALVRGSTGGTFTYITPSWRKYGFRFWLKAWNPDIYEGFIISLYSMDKFQELKLLLGSEDNEKTTLLYRLGKTEVTLKRKTLPHLVPVGKWKGYWLQIGDGKVEIGYEGVTYPFFDWTITSLEMSFRPIFINFGTIKNFWVGVNFQPNECLTIQTTTEKSYEIYPINLGRKESSVSDLVLNLRGTGIAFVTLDWKEEQKLVVHKDDKLMFEWNSSFPLLFYWFAVTTEEEREVIWSANCPPADIDGEPRDGNWGKWGPWSCSVTCGKGHGKIKRTCNNPPPNIFGNKCKGLAVYEGPCNDFPCGKISPNTISAIRQHLSSQYKSLQVYAGERVVLLCNSKGLTLIMTEVPDVNISWTHNGFPYSRTRFHMDENYALVIPRAQEKYNGIYICMAYQDPQSIPSNIILEVVALVVIKPKPSKKVRVGKSLTLKCNGLPLSYVYADLSQRWELNGTVWKNYGLGNLQLFTVDKLENISDSHAGIWTCVIIQEDFKFKWITNWIYLKVKSRPNFWSRLMEDVVTSPFFAKLGSERNAKIAFFALVGTTLIIILLSVGLLIKFLTYSCKKSKLKKFKTTLN